MKIIMKKIGAKMLNSKSKKLFFSLIILFVILSNIFSIEFEFENTWTRYTVYKKGIEVLENMLFVNTYCAIESYDILADGNIELHQVLEVNGLIRDIQLDESDQMLYVHISDYQEDGFDRINAYNIINNELEFSFTSGEVDKFNLPKDLIYLVGNYVILAQPDILPCYNKQTQQIEDITYPYQEIIGSFEDILIEYSISDSSLSFYRIEDINDPILLYQYYYEMITCYRSYIRNFDNSHCLVIDRERILVFNVSDEQNYFFQSLWEIDLTYSMDILFEPKPLENDQLYIGTQVGENFIFNVSDYDSPVLLHNWMEEDSEVNGYCIYDSNLLYRSENFNGIWMYDLSDLPTTQYEEYGETFPFRSTAYIEGFIYKNDHNYLYRIDPETYEEEIICEIPFTIGWDYYKFENLLVIYINYGWNYENYCAIIDLNTNQLLNYITLNGPMLITHNGKIFIQNGDIVNVYDINDSYELEYLTNFTASSTMLINEFDEEHFWVSYDDGDFLFNTISLQIDHDFADFFSPSSQRLAKPCKYDDRLIITDMCYPYDADIRLYDISSLDNPVLLDSKNENVNCSYFQLDDYILESHFVEPVQIYDKFEESFTEPIQEHDFETAIFELIIDEERNRIVSSSSFYNFRTFLFELTGIGIELVPEINTDLSNYPNPFNPTTTISLSIPEESNVELSIFNIKGQKIRTLRNDQYPKGNHSVIWDGKDSNDKRVGSGIYFYKLIAGDFQRVKKMILIK
jgi:hypothetical protein